MLTIDLFERLSITSLITVIDYATDVIILDTDSVDRIISFSYTVPEIRQILHKTKVHRIDVIDNSLVIVVYPDN